MVTLRSQQGKNFIKTSFSELTGFDLQRIKDSTPKSLVLALSDFSEVQVNQMDSTSLIALYELVSFVTNIEDAIYSAPLTIQLPDIDVASNTYQKAELAKIKAISISENYRLFPELARIYFGEEYLQNSAILCLIVGGLIWKDLDQLFERFKDLAGEKPSEEQLEAGIDSLHTFGTYGVVEALASRYNCRPYDVYEWSAEEVYLELTYQQAKNRYTENLRGIEDRKNKGAKRN